MPYTALTIKAILAANFASSGIVGVSIPTMVASLGDAIALWLPTIVVTTQDVGTLGVGTGVGTILLNQPQVLTAMQSAFVQEAIVGPLAPLLLLPLTNSVVQIFATISIQTFHPTVGTGTALATLSVPLTSFPSFGGPYGGRIPTAIGKAARDVLSSYVALYPIVGPVSNVPSTGVGVGVLL